MTVELATPVIDEAKLEELLGRAVVDFGATFHAALVNIGDELGLYRALADADPLTTDELAERTGTHERYVREWLAAQTAGGYVTYDAATDRYTLSSEQAMMFADEDSPAYVPGMFRVASSAIRVEDKLKDAFRTGEGVGWGEHHHGLFHGTETLFRPSYVGNLVDGWIPALDGVEEKLRAGARVADVGCGYGASTVLMAEAYPSSTFVGFDYHAPSVEAANRRAEKAGVADRLHFEVATAQDFPGDDYDFITVFDSLHDMGDPVSASAHVLDALADDGTWMIVEPYAGDRLEDNLNPIGRAFYAASTLICTPCSLDQEGRAGLGAQAGEARIAAVVKEGGFTRFRRATETPFNLIFEARP